MEQPITIFCKVLVVRNGQYTEIVVEDLNRDYTDDLKYVCVVRLPNWQDGIALSVGDVGYLRFQYVIGGNSRYFSKATGDLEIYKYTNNYYMNFYKKEDNCKQDKFDF
jgi:hypothetical protein